ncbi:MAG: 50S ribosomal protein L6 [Alphaproteobacteria bacterium]|jgi:large subunit ribosomal protein L6|nr:50S ribosomal protein L6 [Rhodospirillaceae bacterium]MDP6021940.1 50S ribosomal protein L6 [Alphaproteobacteria bacterium]MDP6254467.1 50S ribosomal protein L6 [Alphaproteobacteria bacterium]MDP7055722.1 50S ribosomal protein L6 [Alphaproteobacteria bacterium]MDP7229315.1 50S ribosomal protein L6 [Alphaproteobacteria bacterium]|tara:strand:+ start:922 stop:1455 length:534 start_codon:yes stop_codon:yes gene_type:complete
MSRIGNKPVTVPDDVTIELANSVLKAKGKLGELSMTVVELVDMSHADNQIVVTPKEQTKIARSMWGMQRSLAQNLVTGVSEGFSKELEIQGVGYRANLQGKMLKLQLGYSHDIDFPIPDGIQIECERPTAVKISGIDKQQVGQVAAKIRSFRPPEPYKGKGVRYVGEYIFRKEGKKK